MDGWVARFWREQGLAEPRTPGVEAHTPGSRPSPEGRIPGWAQGFAEIPDRGRG